jgi:hypothetical protein
MSDAVWISIAPGSGTNLRLARRNPPSDRGVARQSASQNPDMRVARADTSS